MCFTVESRGDEGVSSAEGAEIAELWGDVLGRHTVIGSGGGGWKEELAEAVFVLVRVFWGVMEEVGVRCGVTKEEFVSGGADVEVIVGVVDVGMVCGDPSSTWDGEEALSMMFGKLLCNVGGCIIIDGVGTMSEDVLEIEEKGMVNCRGEMATGVG